MTLSCWRGGRRSVGRVLRAVAASAAVGVAMTAAAFEGRIVTLGPAATETVYALGLGAWVVARDSASRHPAEALGVVEVGYFRQVQAEGVLRLRPTLVVAAAGVGPGSQVELLRRAGVRWVASEAEPSPESFFLLAEAVGEATGRTEAAGAVVRRVRADLERAAAERAGRPQPAAVFVLQGAGSRMSTAGRGTAAAALLELAGSRSLPSHPAYRPVSVEGLLALRPDVIVVGATGLALDEVAEPSPEWASLGVPVVPCGLDRLSFGPRLAEDAAWLAGRIEAVVPGGAAGGRK